MAKKDYYDVLGVSKNSTPEQIKAGYTLVDHKLELYGIKKKS